MTVSRSTAGLILKENCDGPVGGYNDGPCTWDWTWWALNPSYMLAGNSDSSNKAEGTASIHTQTLVGYPIAWWWGYIRKYANVGYGAGRRIHFYQKVANLNIWVPGSEGVGLVVNVGAVDDDFYAKANQDWTWMHGTLTVEGTAILCNYQYIYGGYSHGGDNWIDYIVVTRNDYIRITGLTPGQKVEVYRSSDNTKMDTQTCAGGTTYVDLNILTYPFPVQGHFKIYGTDGSTLIETTSPADVCPGDIWDWTAGNGTLSVASNYGIIYRSAATGTPKTATITANLKTAAGANYPGATIYFSTVLGSVTPASAVTDANGNAGTSLTSTVHALAVVKAQWLGDATVPACSAYCLVHVFYEAEVPDMSKKFQVYVEGVEYAYVPSGSRYTLNEMGVVNDFEVELPAWVSTITPNGLVSIYRKGVQEFAGILKKMNRSLSDAPRVVLSGPDISKLLDDQVVDTKLYSAKSASYIINDLLSSFPCGITAGTLQTNYDSLTITIETEGLRDAIKRICDLVAWTYRVNLNRTLDLAESLTGGNAPIEIVEGDNLTGADRETNYYPVANYIRMKGNGISSTKQDGTKIQEQGLHKLPAYNSSITNQGTLDTACQALLDMKKEAEETIPLECIDETTPGAFGPEDYLTVTSPTLDMAGVYQIRKIERKLEDPNYAALDLENKTREFWELDLTYRRMTKDANV